MSFPHCWWLRSALVPELSLASPRVVSLLGIAKDLFQDYFREFFLAPEVHVPDT